MDQQAQSARPESLTSKVDTGRDAESDTVVSRLSLARARAEDTGNYTCRLDKMPPRTKGRAASRRKGLSDTVTVHVLRGENTEAIQGGSGPAELMRRLWPATLPRLFRLATQSTYSVPVPYKLACRQASHAV